MCSWKWKFLSLVQLFVTLWTMQFMEFSRSEYWSGWPFPSPGDLPNSGIEPRSPTLWQVDSLPAEPQEKSKNTGVGGLSFLQRIFPTQETNQGLLHWGGFFTNWATRDAQCVQWVPLSLRIFACHCISWMVSYYFFLFVKWF